MSILRNVSKLVMSLTATTITVVSLSLLLSQCSRTETAAPKVDKAPYVVSDKDALEVAQQYAIQQQNSKAGAKVNAIEAVIGQETISDEADNKPILYVINRSKGFIIVSADLRTMPVIAHSDNGQFNTKKMPLGIKEWFETAKVKIKDVKLLNIKADSIVIKEWKKYLSGTLNIPHSGAKVANTNCYEWYQYGQYQCRGTFIDQTPLITTSWGQDRLSTTYLGPSGCSSTDGHSCGRYLAGCGPVAMAQIYNYYHPNASFPDHTNGSCTASSPGENAVGQLMATCGMVAGSQYDYLGGCSTFTWPSEVIPGNSKPNVITGLQTMGFSNGGTSIPAYNYQTIKSELLSNHPVIFWGTTCDTCFGDYHIWVCDGLEEHNYSEFDCDTKQCNQWSYSLLDMNWGWDGRSNGWYAFNQYNPGGQNYNTNLHVISGIRP